MTLEEFDREILSEKDKRYIKTRSIMDIGMGILWIGMGAFFLFNKYLNLGWQSSFDDNTLKIFGGVCLLYGSFRVYRGFKKNYLRER